MNQQLFYLSDEFYKPGALPELEAIIPTAQSSAILAELNVYSKSGTAWTLGATTTEATWVADWFAKPLRQLIEDLAYATLHQTAPEYRG